jgi:hypothetical protein
MISESKDLTLYHASYTTIETVDLSLCRKKNDFGQGFYLTTDNNQAERFIKTSIRKSGETLDFGYVNRYAMRDFDGLRCLEFTTTDKDWLHCVCAFRRVEIVSENLSKWEEKEAIIGKIANDDTMTTLTIYLSGGYGAYGSSEAADMAVRVLKPERLKDQICLRTERAIKKLQFLDAYEVTAK